MTARHGDAAFLGANLPAPPPPGEPPGLPGPPLAVVLADRKARLEAAIAEERQLAACQHDQM
ncbi:MAG: hypothetical protein JXP73_10260 [Deltaproteobacteria bacterium]|nr:hypothetical protein [Deltaproteobacteria bacterium]